MTRGEERPVSKSELRNEIQRRLDILGYDVNRDYTFIPNRDLKEKTDDCRWIIYFDPVCLDPDNEDRKIIQKIEENYGVTVYAAIASGLEALEIGEMLTLLTISGNKAEWQREREDLEARMPIAYVQNLTYPELSEWGTVVLKTHDGIVERIG
jgi:predicted transcriptional regulator